MKKFLAVLLFLLGWAFWLGSKVWAGPPLTNAEGVGGCALNPFAYVTNPIKDNKGLMDTNFIGYPQIGIWKVGLYDNKPVGRIDWLAIGANISLFNRIELGYSHEYVDIENLKNVGKDNLSVKVNLIKEGDFNMKFLPALSVGAIYKDTSLDPDKVGADDDSDIDYYIVATKMFPDLPVPVMLNVGLLFTKGIVRGVLGFGDDRDTVFFGNIETVILKKFIVGWEYEAKVDTEVDDQDIRTHAMWEAHIAYMPNEHLMLVVSYAYTGDKDHTGEYAFGNAYVLSFQYSF